jgi:hypothetical protein
MYPFYIVVVAPVSRERPDLFWDCEGRGIQYVVAEGVVKTLDIGILVRLGGLDLGEGDTHHLATRLRGFGDSFQPNVTQQLPRYGVTGHQGVEAGAHVGTPQRVVRLDWECFPITLSRTFSRR